jgi:predicted transposase YdaD
MKYKNNKKYQKELEEILEQDSQVQYLERVFEIFQSDPLFYLETMSAMAKEKEYEQRGLKRGEKRGIKKGRKEGLALGKNEGRLKMCIELINDGLITIEQAANKLNMSVDKMNKLIHN